MKSKGKEGLTRDEQHLIAIKHIKKYGLICPRCCEEEAVLFGKSDHVYLLTKKEYLTYFPSNGHAKFCRVPFHFDHIKPVSKGGTDNIGNYQLLCPSCNKSKGNGK